MNRKYGNPYDNRYSRNRTEDLANKAWPTRCNNCNEWDYNANVKGGLCHRCRGEESVEEDLRR